MASNCPRLVIAGLSGDSGKTITSLSLLAGLKQRDVSLSVFKKGPDYIDAAWLSSAAGSTCRNLDTYMVPSDRVMAAFARHGIGSGLALVEGNRGLFDGKDAQGTHSTAELAKLIGAPVVLVVDCTKTTRTVAAMVAGCIAMDPEVKIAGVVLNRIAGARHRKVVTEAIEQICLLPVLGAIPKLGDDSSLIPGRHLGLITPAEFGRRSDLTRLLVDIANKHLDLDRFMEIARKAESLRPPAEDVSKPKADVRIGCFRDSVFTFYYPENLEALQAEGAELVPISSLEDHVLPELDALYIGGGFPETHAEQLAANGALMKAVRDAVDSDLPVYAECGGLIFLARRLKVGDRSYPMAGVLPVDLAMHRRPVGHGYTELNVRSANPFFPVGQSMRGHEFHYSGPVEAIPLERCCLTMRVGVGLGNGCDGVSYRNCLAVYTHLHADGATGWAAGLTAAAREHRRRREAGRSDTVRAVDDGEVSAETMPLAAVAEA